MPKPEHQDFRQLLVDRQAALRLEAKEGAESTRPVELDQTRVGRLSRMDAMQAQAMANASARHRDNELLRVAAALRRLDNGEFGDCVECCEPIARARLAVDPAASHCLNCAEKKERL